MAPVTQERMSFYAPLTDVELRDSGNGTDFTLTGHAAVFERWSETLSTWAGDFREKIARGAFADVLTEGPDVRLLVNHDENLILGRTKAGTLELSEDERGLRVWARVAPTSYAADLRLAMQRGDIDQMSFAFAVAEDGDEWREDHEDEEVERVILRIAELYDVSVVTFPAYPDTNAAMRELREASRAGKISAEEPLPPAVVGAALAAFSTDTSTTTTPFIVAQGISAGADTSRAADGVSGPNRRLVALRAKGRRARLLTSTTRRDS